MEQQFGIFIENGESGRYGDINTTGLSIVNTELFDSPAEAKAHIDEAEHISAGGRGFLIMPVYEYRKPAN